MPFCQDCGAEIFDGAPCQKCGAAQTSHTISNPPIGDTNPLSISIDKSPVADSISPVKPKHFINQFQKNVLFVAVTIFILVVGCILVNDAIQQRAKHVEEQKVQWKKANIKILKGLSGIGALSTEEQTRVDNAGDDLDRLQQVLIDIHQERITFWSGRVKQIGEQSRDLPTNYYSEAIYGNSVRSKLQRELAEANDNLAGYQASIDKIRNWKPISFEDFRAGKSIDPGSSEQPKSGEQ